VTAVGVGAHLVSFAARKLGQRAKPEEAKPEKPAAEEEK